MPENTRRTLVLSLTISGIVITAVGIGVGIAVGPAYFAIAAFGLVDFVLAWMFHTGRLGGPAAAPEQPIDPTADPSYNPYARED
jgi:hypothetical protein